MEGHMEGHTDGCDGRTYRRTDHTSNIVCMCVLYSLQTYTNVCIHVHAHVHTHAPTHLDASVVHEVHLVTDIANPKDVVTSHVCHSLYIDPRIHASMCPCVCACVRVSIRPSCPPVCPSTCVSIHSCTRPIRPVRLCPSIRAYIRPRSSMRKV